MLQSQAVVSRSLVFAAVVLAIIHINMVQLQEAYKISGCLGFAFGDIINPRSPEEEVTLLPRLFPILFEPQDTLDLWHRHRASTEAFL